MQKHLLLFQSEVLVMFSYVTPTPYHPKVYEKPYSIKMYLYMAL